MASRTAGTISVAQRARASSAGVSSVVDADDLGRIPARGGRGGVDAGAGLAVELAQPVRTSRRDPAVGQLPGDGQGLRADRAGEHPGSGRGRRVQAIHVVELAVEGDRVSPAGQRADQRDRLGHGAHRGPAVEPGDAELGDHVPDRPGPDAQDDPAAGQRGQRGERARQHRRGTAGQVGHGHHAGDAFGPAEQEPGQRVRVQFVAEVRVVGHGEQVQAVPVGLGGEPDAPGRVGGIRAVPLAKRGTEQDIVSWHQQSFRRSPLDTSPPPDIMPQAFPRKPA
jgi:hypothetical protein